MKIKNFFLSLFMGLLLIGFSSGEVLADEEAMGKIVKLSGLLKIQRSGETSWLTARRQTDVFFGDTLTTGEDAVAVIQLVDDSIMRVHANSKIVLNTKVSPVEKKNSVLLFFGRLWNKISKKALRKKVFEVQTPTAVCGVRGTDFETASYEDGTVLIRVNTGEVEVDTEAVQKTLATNQGTQVSFEQKDIRVESDFQPDWEQDQATSREKLLGDGEKYGGYVHDEIYKRRDDLKKLVDRAAELKATKEDLRHKASQAKEAGDAEAYEAYQIEIQKITEAQKMLNQKIAYEGRRLECHFGLFSHYGDLAKDPEISKRFKGREYILNQLDDIESIYAEFNAMVEEGMKMSMEDMEDLMDEMRDKMDAFKNKKKSGSIFEELN